MSFLIKLIASHPAIAGSSDSEPSLSQPVFTYKLQSMSGKSGLDIVQSCAFTEQGYVKRSHIGRNRAAT